MTNVAVPLARGFEEIEAMTIVDVLRRAEFNVYICTLEGNLVEGAHGVKVEAGMELAEALERDWDLVVLPGGMPGASNLRNDDRVGELLRKTAIKGGYVGAVCAAPIALYRFGLLKGRRCTSYPGFEKEMPGSVWCEDRVVCDGNVITSRGPGTALEFALFLVSKIAGEERASGLRERMLAG